MEDKERKELDSPPLFQLYLGGKSLSNSFSAVDNLVLGDNGIPEGEDSGTQALGILLQLTPKANRSGKNVSKEANRIDSALQNEGRSSHFCSFFLKKKAQRDHFLFYVSKCNDSVAS